MHAMMASDGVVEFMSRTLSHMKQQVSGVDVMLCMSVNEIGCR